MKVFMLIKQCVAIVYAEIFEVCKICGLAARLVSTKFLILNKEKKQWLKETMYSAKIKLQNFTSAKYKPLEISAYAIISTSCPVLLFIL